MGENNTEEDHWRNKEGWNGQENGKRWRGRVRRWRVEGLNLAAKSLQGKSGLLKVHVIM